MPLSPLPPNLIRLCRRKADASQLEVHLNWNPLTFLSDCLAQRILTRFPPDIWQAFFSKGFGALIPKMLAHAQGRTFCSCKMCIDPLGDHVLTCMQHTGLS